MATFTTREVVTRHREWAVPCGQPWGAPAAEVAKAWTAAERAYRKAHSVPETEQLHDDALRFHVRDTQIVISFTVEEAGT